METGSVAMTAALFVWHVANTQAAVRFCLEFKFSQLGDSPRESAAFCGAEHSKPNRLWPNHGALSRGQCIVEFPKFGVTQLGIGDIQVLKLWQLQQAWNRRIANFGASNVQPRQIRIPGQRLDCLVGNFRFVEIQPTQFRQLCNSGNGFIGDRRAPEIQILEVGELGKRSGRSIGNTWRLGFAEVKNFQVWEVCKSRDCGISDGRVA